MQSKKRFIFVFILATVAVGFAFSYVVSAHAQVVGVTLPSVPTGVTATAGPSSEISVAWTASAETSGTIEGYYVYRNGVQIATVAGTSFIDSNLTSGVYMYAVAAYDANGIVSSQSSPTTVTLSLDTTPPTAPTDVTIVGATTTNSEYTQIPLTISWNASTDNVGVAGYYVYRNGLLITTSTSAFTGTSIADTVAPGMYTYAVIAYDAAQNFSNRSTPATVTITVDTNTPTVPTHVFAQQVSATNVNLSWASSSDVIGIAGYQIFRDGTQIASAAGSPYSDSGLSAGVAYSYAVAAYDAAGNTSAQSTPVSVTFESASGPGMPNDLATTLVGTSTVALSWEPVGDTLFRFSDMRFIVMVRR